MKKSSLILIVVFIATIVTPIIANSNIFNYLANSKSKEAVPRWFVVGLRVSDPNVNNIINFGLEGKLDGLELYINSITKSGLGLQLTLGGPSYTVDKYSYELEYGYVGIALHYHKYNIQSLSSYIGVGSVLHKESIGYEGQITNVGSVYYLNMGWNKFADKIIQLNIDLKAYGNPNYRYPDQVDIGSGSGAFHRPDAIKVSPKIVLNIGISINANLLFRKI